MNKRTTERFLRAILQGEELELLRERSLEAGLSSMRRQRRNRRVQACAVACLLLLPAWLMFSLRHAQPISSQLTTTAPAVLPAQQAKLPPIEQISDQELLALFPGQTVALIGPAGDQRFLVLETSQGHPGQPREQSN